MHKIKAIKDRKLDKPHLALTPSEAQVLIDASDGHNANTQLADELPVIVQEFYEIDDDKELLGVRKKTLVRKTKSWTRKERVAVVAAIALYYSDRGMTFEEVGLAAS